MDELTIGRLARKARVGVETIRYYERRGLLPAPPRDGSGYRIYGPEDVARIRFIKRAQSLGFSLQEILDLLSLQADPNASCAEVKARAEAKMADIDQKIAALQKIRRALALVSAQCRGRGPVSGCAILEALEAED